MTADLIGQVGRFHQIHRTRIGRVDVRGEQAWGGHGGW